MSANSADGPYDPLPAMRASLDQAIAQWGEIARMQKGMFDAYLEAGFSRDDALKLTALFLANPPQSSGDDE